MLNGSGIRINKLSYKRKEIEREEYSCTQGCSSPSFFVSGRQAKYAENNPCHSIVTATVTALSQPPDRVCNAEACGARIRELRKKIN